MTQAELEDILAKYIEEVRREVTKNEELINTGMLSERMVKMHQQFITEGQGKLLAVIDILKITRSREE